MRLLLALALLAAAAPAAAQLEPRWDANREAELAAREAILRQREVALQNQLTVLETRLRAEEAARQIELQRQRPELPPFREAASAPRSTAGYASIPDSRLAASAARVRAAAENRR